MYLDIRTGYQAARLISFTLATLYFRIRVFGVHHVPRTGGLILAGNHQSVVDPLLLAYPLPRECHYMARDTLFLNRHFASLIRYFNAFPVKRATADLGAVKETLRRLDQGAAVMVFPEATRTTDGRIRPLQPGIFSIARKARVPIVPVVIEGGFEAWPRHQHFPRPGPVWVEYGQPLPRSLIEEMDAPVAAAVFTAQLRELHNRLRRRMARPPLTYEF